MTQTTPSSVDAMREAIADVINAAWSLCDDTAEAQSDAPQVPRSAWQKLSDALDALERIIPDSEQPCWPGVAARLLLSTLPSDGVTIPADGWRCFHCGEHFTSEQCARLHFGRDEMSDPACIIKAGAEGSLLKALRRAEEAADDAIQAMHAESTDAAKAYHAQRCRHTQALIAAEELGYERGLADGRALSARSGGVDPA